jgi:ketosteroid isomerase-like protein
MSANLDLVRSIYADWERGDLSSAQWAHPDVEYVEHGGHSHEGLAPSRAEGVASMTKAAGEFVSAWDGWTIVAEEMRELDDQRILVLNRYSARGKHSGLAVRQLGAHVFLVRDGRVAQLTVYPDRDRAFADLGLTPESDATQPD